MTTTLVVEESHGRFLKRYDRTKALQFLGMLEAMQPLRVLSVGDREVGLATQLLRQFADQGLTLADAVGLHLMEARRVQSCWSTDFHLGLTGVPLLIHEH